MQVSFSSFRREDDTASFAAAMEYLRNHPNTTLFIEPGVYSLTSALARETMQHVMNGDYGDNPQPIMFSPQFAYTRGIDFDGQNGTTVLADGVTVMVDGFMEPVSLRNCKNVTLKGLTVDHVRKPYTQGTIIAIDLPDENNCSICSVELEQPVTEHSPFMLRNSLFGKDSLEALPCDICDIKFVDSLHLAITVSNVSACHIGDLFGMIHTYHSRPAVLIEYSYNITIDGITIHSQPGMGIVGNRSENIYIRNISIIPSPGQIWSSNTDATHFTSIKGDLSFENCIISHQGDDFINCHAYFHAIIKRDSDTVCYLQEKTPDGTHAQSLDYPDVGDIMELTERDTLLTIDSYKVVECIPMPDRWMCRVTFDKPLPKVTDHLMLADVTRLPDLTVKSCKTSNHFARGILIKTRSAKIIGNIFRNIRGPAVEAAAEAWWFEGVCPANVEICDNLIEGCGWDCDISGILVKADSDHPAGQSIKNITIADNIIKSDKSCAAISCRNVDGLRIHNNSLPAGCKQPIVIKDCINIE